MNWCPWVYPDAATLHDVIELFAVAPGEDEAFLAAWAAEEPLGATLYRALRPDVRLRFASVSPDAQGGALLIAAFDVPRGEDERLRRTWEAVRELFAARQGFVDARLERELAAVWWSSPLMYARAVREHDDPVATLPYLRHAAVYGRVE